MATILVALLRGINVGRNKRVGMFDLRSLLAGLGYAEVRTLLQSGNAVFTCSDDRARTAWVDIEQALTQKLGLESKVMVRTPEELDAAIAADPLRDVVTDPARHMLGFLSGEPSAASAEVVANLDVAPDQISLVGRHVYLWLPNGVIDSRLGKVGWEKSLGVAVTMRNWNTVTKLAAMARKV